MDMRFEDLNEKAKSGPGCCGGACCCFLSLLFILFVPASIKQLGQKRYGLTKNNMSGVVDLEVVYGPGRYWLGFWRGFIEFPSTLNTIEFSDEQPEEGVLQQGVLESRDQDGKRVYLDVSLQYRLIPENVGQMYRDHPQNYEDVMISGLRDRLSKVGNQFAINKVWENYGEATRLMKEACISTLRDLSAECWDLQLWRVRLEDAYEGALINTQVQKQAQETARAVREHSVVRAETQVVLAAYRRNVTVIKSQGQARKFELERSARAEAEAATIRIKGDALEAVRDIVVLNRSSTITQMDDKQIVQYQKLLMLQGATESHFLLSNSAYDPVNMQAARAMVDEL